MRISLGIEYDGSAYSGWQRQPHAPSVQETLEKALSRVADHDIQVACAGRTDAGVHALEQVVHFDSDAVRDAYSWTMGGTVNLPHDIAVLWAQPVDDMFHARHSATARSYRYVILNRPVRPAIGFHGTSWVYRSLDAERMHEAAQYLLGEHDFTSFRAQKCQSRTPVRRVRYIDVRRHGEHIVIEIEANAFLHHMVRNIAGVLTTVGGGQQPVGWVGEVLSARDRTCAGITASPQGLYLRHVSYPDHFGLPQKGVDAAGKFADFPCQ